MEAEKEYNMEDIEEPWWKGPLKYILGVILIFIIVLWYFPAQAIKLDPEPKYIPSISEVVPPELYTTSYREHIEINSRNDYLKFIQPDDHFIKQTADNIVTLSCNGNKICHAKAIYYFIQDNFQYVSDPTAYEYVKGARESLTTISGDCDDASVLAASLLNAVGIRTRFVFIPGHVYIQAYLPDALKRYKTQDEDYVSLDLTCSNCKFGELPYSDYSDGKVVVG